MTISAALHSSTASLLDTCIGPRHQRRRHRRPGVDAFGISLDSSNDVVMGEHPGGRGHFRDTDVTVTARGHGAAASFSEWLV